MSPTSEYGKEQGRPGHIWTAGPSGTSQSHIKKEMTAIFDMIDAELGNNNGFRCLFYGKGSRLKPSMDKAYLCLRLHACDDYFALHDHLPSFSYLMQLMPHMSMSTVIYARENSPASQSLKLKSGLNVGVSSIIITGMEGNTESFYFRKTDFGPLQHCFTASKDRRFSKLPRLSKLGHTV